MPTHPGKKQHFAKISSKLSQISGGRSARVVTDPAAAGLAEVEKPCITPGTIDHPFCEQPDEYLFWDSIHPTAKGHALLAEAAQQALVSTQR